MSGSTIADIISTTTPAQPSPQSASVTPATEPASKPTSSEALKNLTPDQIVEELKKSGYFDGLRRQLFEAFTTSPPPKSASQPSLPAVAPTPTSSQPDSQNPNNPQPNPQPSPATTQAAPNTSTTTSTATPDVPHPANLPSKSSSAEAIDIGTKQSFTTFLATPLRFQVEKEHDRLRFLDPRGQQDDLLKLLESDPVDHPQRETLGEATIYDLLIHSLTTTDAAGKESGTNGILSKEGKLGKEMLQKIGEVIAEISKSKDDAEDEEEDDEEEGEGDEEETLNAGEVKAGQTPQISINTSTNTNFENGRRLTCKSPIT